MCVDDLIEAHDSYMLELFHKTTLSFYWLPKLHKNPYGHRFIAAASACTTKPLSKLFCDIWLLSAKGVVHHVHNIHIMCMYDVVRGMYTHVMCTHIMVHE